MSKKQKYYVVWVGAKPGVYDTWDEAKAQVTAYPGARHRSFFSKAEAERAFAGSPDVFAGKTTGKPRSLIAIPRSEIIWDSISVDAACSGNPGVMEYQGVHTRTGTQLFHNRFPVGTNNIGEFLAIVHALAQLKKEAKDTPIYTDSKTAYAWVKKKKCKSKLSRDHHTEDLWQVVERAEQWLKSNTYPNPILKWATESWGEIPADFGRK